MGNAKRIHWRDSAACTTDEAAAAFGDDWDDDPEYPESLDTAEEFAATICSRCPVIEQCLKYAVDNDIQYGVFGGMTAEDRGLENVLAD